MKLRLVTLVRKLKSIYKSNFKYKSINAYFSVILTYLEGPATSHAHPRGAPTWSDVTQRWH